MNFPRVMNFNTSKLALWKAKEPEQGHPIALWMYSDSSRGPRLRPGHQRSWQKEDFPVSCWHLCFAFLPFLKSAAPDNSYMGLKGTYTPNFAKHKAELVKQERLPDLRGHIFTPFKSTVRVSFSMEENQASALLGDGGGLWPCFSQDTSTCPAL